MAQTEPPVEVANVAICPTQQDKKRSTNSAHSTHSKCCHHRKTLSKNSLKRSTSSKPSARIGDYHLTSTLGSGAMGKVKLGVHYAPPYHKIAIKIVPRQSRTNTTDKRDDKEERTRREASILYLLKHPYIVSLQEPIVTESNYYYLLMEYVSGGQLLDYIISHGKLKEKHARRFARQIMSALDYCHRNSIVHRDLKIENILISRAGHVKIIDFGLSNLFSPSSQLSTFCGSLYFAAPELLQGKLYTGPEVDVWSFGVVLYVLVCGKVPFDDKSVQALHDRVKRGAVEYPPHLSSECKSLLQRILILNPAQRATVSEIMVHPWMVRGYDGPVDNHLPARAPIALPLDREVIQRMADFDFGTVEEIQVKLEELVSSEAYQAAAAAKSSAALQRKESRKGHRRGDSTASVSTNSFLGGILGGYHHHAPQAVFPAAEDDPQTNPAAYHPLVSLYHLIQERMQPTAQQDHNELPLSPPAYEEIGQTQQAIRSRPLHHQKSASHAAAATLIPSNSVGATGSSPEPTSRGGRGHRKAKSYAPFNPLQKMQSLPEPVPGRLQPQASVSSDTRSQGEPASKRGHRRMGSLFRTQTQTHTQAQHHHHNDGAVHAAADENVRPVYLKGLFSMKTTSTKHPTELRQNLIQVLGQKNIEWTEAHGQFECSLERSHFEIHIVKVPWLLGMHGLQFRRVSGDSWEYKTTCSEILSELKL
ncbi:kinase-like domain-containing protein [Syncephalastrum racemosum]|uniref:non-specific serine/threonine protein kinase n=1 Tax=Syncephalastrum racemosum TaxID=13706 RepID=A0A1X2HNP6_SYNRA|nr:kinase-like domain-containing protein [Syncephalastrum racemosum]